jgi:hypothetical protein
MLKPAISDHANARPTERRRWALLAAGVLALLGSFAVTAPAQAGYYGDYGYGDHPCSYRCGGYTPYRYRCSACGCYRRCYSGSRSVVYERRYVEREYVERRYGCCRHHYGYGYGGGGYGGYGGGGYGGYGGGGFGGYRHYGNYPFGGYQRPFPYGYGGVRYWQAPSGYYRFGEPYAEGSGGGYYDAPPRPPAPIDEY